MNELTKANYILNARFNKTFVDIFLELEGINPKSEFSLSNFTQYPEEWLHNRKVFTAMRICFEAILLDSDETLQRKFRAYLALIFLHDGNRSFPGCEKFSLSEKNKITLACARLVYNSDNFDVSFQEVEKNILMQLNNLLY